jgi:hypothetical protein
MLTAAPNRSIQPHERPKEQSMSDIFREVDEEVRRDKAEEFWKKYQNHILAVAVVIVAVTAGYRFYLDRQIKAAQAAGAQFEQALELDHGGNGADAIAALRKSASEAPSGYKSLSKLAQAAMLSKTDPKGATEAYDALAQDASIGSLFQDAARLRAALLRIDAGDTANAKTALEGLAAPAGAFRHTAREMLGVIALNGGDMENAGKWLDMVVSDAEAPPGVRKNAQALLGIVASGRPAPK